jgi:hypothetical protein
MVCIAIWVPCPSTMGSDKISKARSSDELAGVSMKADTHLRPLKIPSEHKS